MIQNSSNKTRQKFLKKFTKELVETAGMQKQEKVFSNKEKTRIKKEIEIDKLKKKYIKPEIKPPVLKNKEQKIVPKIQKRQFAPQPQQPAFIQQMPYVPSPFLDLGKINALIKDPAVTSIECEKPNKNLIIKKNGQIMEVSIKLIKEEIDKIIYEFSEKARIPLIEGLLRARVSNLQISAVVSKVSSSRFIITKLINPAASNFQKPSLLQKYPAIPQQPRLAPRIPMPAINRPFAPGANPRPPAKPNAKPTVNIQAKPNTRQTANQKIPR